MQKLLLSILLVSTACAHDPNVVAARVAAPRAVDTPALWTSPPPRALYRFVGRVQGVAATTDLVAAARAATDDLRWKAHALGADVVRIDYVAVPREHGRPSRRVLVAGAAYKAIAHP